MAAKGDHVDFMFLGHPPTRPLDPMLETSQKQLTWSLDFSPLDKKGFKLGNVECQLPDYITFEHFESLKIFLKLDREQKVKFINN